MAPEDLLTWRKFTGATLSPDGKWLAYVATEGEGDGELVIKAVAGGIQYREPVGQGVVQPRFSDDSAWVAFPVHPTRTSALQAGAEGKPPRSDAVLLQLSSGAKHRYTRVREIAFARSGSVLLHHYPVSGHPTSAGRDGDLLVRDLRSGRERLHARVGEFATDTSGRWLAWAASDEAGAGSLRVCDLETGLMKVVDQDSARYQQLAWSREGRALAALKGMRDEEYVQPQFVVLGVTDVAAHPLRLALFDPATRADFPAGMRISPSSRPQWSGDRRTVLLGLDKHAERRASAPAEAAGQTGAEVIVWHWRDARLQSQQKLQEAADRDRTYPASWRPAEGRFFQLLDENLRLRPSSVPGKWRVATDSNPYYLQASMDGRFFSDVYFIDMETGARRLVEKQVRWLYEQSPDGNRLLYYKDGHFHVYDAATDRSRAITRGAAVSFIDVDNDTNVIDPPVPPVGWSADSRSVVLSDLWDLWRVPVDGGKAVNLTTDGRARGIRYKRVQLDREETGIDLSRPQYFVMQDLWTKKGGVMRWRPDSPPQPLVFDDVYYSSLGMSKARSADVLLYRRATPTSYPDLLVSDGAMRTVRRMSDGQEWLSRFQWTSGVRLIDYRVKAERGEIDGRRMQGILHLPANYQAGRRYPTIVNVYERFSDFANAFSEPGQLVFPVSFFTSNGYAVLQPDIRYAVNDPGMSALWCLQAALKAALDTGIVDESAMGLQGHSWGGYEAAFLVTRMDVFKAALAGAPITDLVSFYGLLYKQSGTSLALTFESSQARIGGTPWEHWDDYLRNSPIVRADRITTPMLLLHNEADPNVDFSQGLEYYNALRRLGKPAVMLQYPGEGHFVEKLPNKVDYYRRMLEFFDHHLRGAPAPAWWTSGVSYADRPRPGSSGLRPALPVPAPYPPAGMR